MARVPTSAKTSEEARDALTYNLNRVEVDIVKNPEAERI